MILKHPDGTHEEVTLTEFQTIFPASCFYSYPVESFGLAFVIPIVDGQVPVFTVVMTKGNEYDYISCQSENFEDFDTVEEAIAAVNAHLQDHEVMQDVMQRRELLLGVMPYDPTIH